MTSQDIAYNIPVSPDSQLQQPNGKKAGGKGLWIAISAVVVVIAVLAVGIVNFAAVNNFVHKTFSSPEDYYRYVEKNALKESVSVTGDRYSNTVLDWLDIFNQKRDVKISVKLGEKGREYVELLEMQSGVDLSWLDSVGIDAGVSFADDFVGATLGAVVNGEGIVSGELLMDIEEGKLYLQIPELSETYIGAEIFDRETTQQIKGVVDKVEDLKEALPDQVIIETLFLRYSDIVLDHAEDVTIDKKATIEAGDIEQKCTELEVVFDDDTLKEIWNSILEEMIEDEELKDIIIDVAKIIPNVDSEDVYKGYVKGLKEAKKSLEEISSNSKMKLVMTVYVDGKGEIKGRKFKFTDGPEITELMPEKGKGFGYELTYKYSGSSLVLSGSGQRSGENISGDFSIKIDKESYLDITAKDVNVEALKRRQLNGKISVKPTSALMKEMGVAGIPIKNVQLDIEAVTENNSYEYKLTLLFDNKEIGELSVSGNTQPAPDMKAPKDVIFFEYLEDWKAWEDWLEDVDWDNIIDNLEKADFPSEIVDQVKYATRMLEGGYF